MSSSTAHVEALPHEGGITLVSACSRFKWLFHSLTFPAQDVYARSWGLKTSFYLLRDDPDSTWDRLRMWQEALKDIPPGDWMWYLGPGCMIANVRFDWRSLGPFDGDLIIGGDERHFNFDSFLLRNTPQTHAFLERVRKIKRVVATEDEAMTLLIVADLIKTDVRPPRQLAAHFAPNTPDSHDGPSSASRTYQAGDAVLQFPAWQAESFHLLHKVTAPYRNAAAAPRKGRIHRTYCVHALGDNMAHLHFLRKLAQRHPDHRFIHQAQTPYLAQLGEMIEDVDNVVLEPMQRVDSGTIDAWKNAECYWEVHRFRNDYAAFFIEFFRQLAARMGLESPIATPADLLFDYPALRKPTALDGAFDFLIVNSTALSGQFQDRTSMDGLIAGLAQKYRVIVTQATAVPNVVCTQTHGLSVTGIGRLSQQCRYIVMVSTGSSWGTFNVWNIDSVEFRLVLLEHEVLGLSKHTTQAASVECAERVLRESGYL